MTDMVWLVPLIPLLSSILLMFGSGSLPRLLIGLLGVSSVGIAAVLTLLVGMEFLANPQPVQLTLWTWMQVGILARA